MSLKDDIPMFRGQTSSTLCLKLGSQDANGLERDTENILEK